MTSKKSDFSAGFQAKRRKSASLHTEKEAGGWLDSERSRADSDNPLTLPSEICKESSLGASEKEAISIGNKEKPRRRLLQTSDETPRGKIFLVRMNSSPEDFLLPDEKEVALTPEELELLKKCIKIIMNKSCEIKATKTGNALDELIISCELADLLKKLEAIK